MVFARRVYVSAQADSTCGVKADPKPCFKVHNSAAPTVSKWPGNTPYVACRRPRLATTGTSAAEVVAADAMGNIYGAEVGPKRMMKYVRN